MAAASSLAENLARFRKARDLSQEELAEAAGLSVDTVARIERGERRSTPRPATIEALAGALRVTTLALCGEDSGADTAGRVHAGVAALRRAITAHGEIPGLADFAEDADVLPLPALTRAAHTAWRAYVNGDHTTLFQALPALLTDARRFVRVSHDDTQAAGQRVLSTAYRLGAGLAGRFDLDDLALSSAERAYQAAQASDAPELESAISLRYLVWTLVRQGRAAEAERVAVAAAAAIEPRMLDRDPIRAGVFANLLFNAASAALREGNGREAADLLAIAQSAAVRSGRDVATEAAIFGPRVAALQVVDHALRIDDPETALHLGSRVPSQAGEVPAFWEAGHRLHLAAAAVELRRYRQAVSYLAEGRRIAPDWVRQQPLGQRTMLTLVDRAPRRQGEYFAELAQHYGVVR